jgi:hypothetical protein
MKNANREDTMLTLHGFKAPSITTVADRKAAAGAK